MTYRFATINGHALRFRAAGEGPLAIFGHGLLGSIEQVDQIADLTPLQDDIHLVTYDARGHGQSGGPEATHGYTWETLGLDMAEIVAHHGEEAAILGGGSMGAATALWVALERPERARAVVCVMPPPLGGPALQAGQEKQAIMVLDMLAAAVENYGVEKTVELARMMPGFAGSPAEAEARSAWLRKQNPLTLKYAIRGLMQSPFHEPEAYRRIRVPVLVLAHEGDGLHPARAAQLLGEHVPDCTVRVAPDPTYWTNHQDELLGEVRRFLARVG